MIGKNRKLLLLSVGRLLRPISSLCLRHGIKIREVVELLKRAFVDSAEHDLSVRDIQSSASKLSAMTGLQRKDLVRLASVEGVPEGAYDLVTRIVGQWTYDRRFVSKAGKPLKLTLEGKVGTFRDLVESVSSDLNPYTVLFELERAGVAERNQKGEIVLQRNTLSLGAEASKGLELLADDQEVLIEAVNENIFDRPEIPNHHIRTYFDNICPEFEAEIREWFLDKGQEWHKEAREFLSRFDKDLNAKLADKPGGMKAVITSFSLVEQPLVKEEAPVVKGVRRSKK